MCTDWQRARPVAITGLRQSHSSLRVVSVGVGTYPAPAYRGWKGVVHLLRGIGALQKSFGINTETMEQLRRDLFPDVAAVRINDHFTHRGAQSISSSRMCANSIFFFNVAGGHSRVTKRMCERCCREAHVPGVMFSASPLAAQPDHRRKNHSAKLPEKRAQLRACMSAT